VIRSSKRNFEALLHWGDRMIEENMRKQKLRESDAPLERFITLGQRRLTVERS
jgi:hypothetical protein